MTRTPAPKGDLQTFPRERFEHGGLAFDVYRKGQGPAVLVITEMPGISPQVLGFADRVVAMGCTAVLPDLFGKAGKDPLTGGTLRGGLYYAKSIASVCIRRDFNLLVSGRTSPVVTYLRALARHEHERCGGPGVGVVGMCFTGGFALAVATEPCVLAPVLAQPSLPVAVAGLNERTIDCSPDDLAKVANRCAREGLDVLGLRFHGDPLVPKERFAYLREKLGDRFVAVEIDQKHGHAHNPLRRHHSVMTLSLIDEPGEPTHTALSKVLSLFEAKLLGAQDSASAARS